MRHGHAANGGTRTYKKWKSMLERCNNPLRPDWPRYGGRRIRVCERWHSFANFVADMGICPDGLTLDRIDNNGNYEPRNCHWTTWEAQYRNRRSNAGQLHPNAKLTIGDVVLIRRMSHFGVDQYRLASVFDISRANVGYILRRQAWVRLVRPVELDGEPFEM